MARHQSSQQEQVSKISPLKTSLALWHAAAGLRWRLVIALLATLAYVACALMTPALSAHIIDAIWTEIQASFAAGKNFVLTLENGGTDLLLYLGLWTFAWIFYSIQVAVMASFSERLNLNLRTRISKKIAHLPLSYLDDKKPGDLISRATNDLDKVSEVLQRGLLQLVLAACMLIGSVMMMAQYNLLLTAVFALFIILSVLATHVIATHTLKVSDQRQRATGVLTGNVEEAYTGRAVLLAFGGEEKSTAALAADADELARTSLIADFLINSSAPAVRFLIRIALVIIAILAGQLLVAGEITIGIFQAFFHYVGMASEPLTQLSQTVNLMQAAIAAAARVFELLDEEEMEPDPASPRVLPAQAPGRVVFSHVRFGYDPARPLMHDVSFVVEAGQKVAIVGATGAGKTTLINLLMRFYEIDGGAIELDGVSTREMRRADLRRRFGMVLQDAWLLEGTIAENIAYGHTGASREEIMAAARAAHVDYFLRTLPQGYETLVSNDAETISQGQRQLITIARAMLLDPAILILDEATSSVDTQTEQEIVAAMEALMYGRTSFVIAHRLSTVVDADMILVMEAGSIIEQGTHAELLKRGGAYAKLYQSQFA
ncbi:ABC transporter ATP-binding protein [Collinsella ureilytica]|uniref:ABC transporter ATP-binding protein n=1 Tax=Collinsella ureilytica TaxID=2869515 RepID=UPI00352F0054